ncbi:MAG: DUF3617 family protein [Myxococcota bacterium]
MKMPPRSQQVCTPVRAEGPEALSGGDDRCQMTNVKRSASRFSWDVTCPDGSGTGEMVYEGRDAYTSTMTMTAEGRTMKMVTRGKRIGDCDASQMKKQVAAVQAQANQGMEQMCAGMVDALLPGNLQTYQCAPKYKSQLCGKFQTKAGFAEVASRQVTGQAVLDSGTLPEVSRFCGVDGEAMRSKLCGEASRSEDLAFLGKTCPDQGRVIAQRECAGRSFSSPPAERYREFCNDYARAQMQGDSAGDSAPPSAGATPAEAGAPSSGSPGSGVPGQAVQEGAKKLKGLLGF